MHFIVLTLQIICVYFVISLGAFEEKVQTSGDFAKLVSSPSFVDRTLLIKAWLEDRDVILLTAPRQSGKSTVLNMLTRFLEVPVNGRGDIIDRNLTLNHKLFKENSLNIYKHTKFFYEHFGKYPVIFVEFQRPIGEISYQEVLNSFREMLRCVFTHHKYLLYHRYLWLDPVEIDRFNDYLFKKRRFKLSPPSIIKALPYLAEILKMHFGRRAVVLVDDYDALMKNIDLRFNADAKKITAFLDRFYRTLMESRKVVGRVLLTGLCRGSNLITLESGHRDLPRNLTKYNYLDSIPICNIFRTNSSTVNYGNGCTNITKDSVYK